MEKVTSCVSTKQLEYGCGAGFANIGECATSVDDSVIWMTSFVRQNDVGSYIDLISNINDLTKRELLERPWRVPHDFLSANFNSS